MCIRRFPAPVYGLPPSAHCGVDLFLHLSASRAGESAQTTEVRAMTGLNPKGYQTL